MQKKDPDRRLSATERLFPGRSLSQSSLNATSPNTTRDSWDLGPAGSGPSYSRPSAPSRDISSSRKPATVDLSNRVSPSTVAKVRPVVPGVSADYMDMGNWSTSSGANKSSAEDQSRNKSTEESPKQTPKSRSALFRERHSSPRRRFMTISSSQPVKLEQSSPTRKEFRKSAAGDLIISDVSLPYLTV